MNVSGAHVFITGASRGIGAALAREFARHGAHVSIAARSADALEEVASEIGGRAFVADLLVDEVVDGLIERVEAEAGPIDVLVNNAGLETTAWFEHIDRAALRDVARLNLEVPMMLTRDAIGGMTRRGSGHIVVISSLAGTGGFPGMAAYGATKAGLTNFIAALRMELDGSGVHTTVVAPGPVDTEMWEAVEDENELGPLLDRLNRLRILPKKSPEMLAKKTVAAVRSDRRHVRVPRRLAANHWLREAPGRLTENLLRGVRVGPRRDSDVT